MKPTRNLWPHGIITTFILFFCGTITLVVIASRQHVELVNANYYEQEIKYQSRIDGLIRAQQLGAKITYDAKAKEIVFSLPPEQRDTNATGTIELYRPSAAGMDRQFQLKTDAHGTQVLDIAGLQHGLWKIRVSWTLGNRDYFLDQQIIVGAS